MTYYRSFVQLHSDRHIGSACQKSLLPLLGSLSGSQECAWSAARVTHVTIQRFDGPAKYRPLQAFCFPVALNSFVFQLRLEECLSRSLEPMAADDTFPPGPLQGYKRWGIALGELPR